METTFPFGFPITTAFYLVLYVATFVLHQAFVQYVIAGMVVVVWAICFPGNEAEDRARQPLPSVVRDWAPLFLSAAITAGIAPLLFVQILYARQFYTANLLLSWRWMVVIPVLIVAFYLLYLVKSATIFTWPYAARVAVVVFLMVCLLFVGFCWSANHLVSNLEGKWPEIYASGKIAFPVQDVLCRLAIWLGGSFATLSAIAGWQLFWMKQSLNETQLSVASRRLSWLAIVGLLAGCCAAGIYFVQSPEVVQKLVAGAMGQAYLAAAIVGVVLQIVAWGMQMRSGIRPVLLAVASSGGLLTLGSVAVLREVIRLSVVDITALYDRHADAGRVGGLVIFLVFAVLNSAVIGYCIWLVRQRLVLAEDRK